MDKNVCLLLSGFILVAIGVKEIFDNDYTDALILFFGALIAVGGLKCKK